MNTAEFSSKVGVSIQAKPSSMPFLIFGIFNFIYVAGLFGFSRGSWALHAWTDSYWAVSGILASMMALRAWRLSPAGRGRSAWLWVFFSSAIWTLGILIWSWQELIEQHITPSPGLADIGPFGFGIFSIVAVSKLLRPHGKSRLSLTEAFELLISIGAVALITGVLFFNPLLELNGNPWRLLFPIVNSMTYATGLVLGVLFLSRGELSVSWPAAALVLLGMTLNLGAHFAYLYATIFKKYEAGLFIDILWVTAFSAIALAADVEIRYRSKAFKNYGALFSGKIILAFFWAIFLGCLSIGLFSYRELVPGLFIFFFCGGFALAVLIILYLRMNWMKEVTARLQVERALRVRDEFLAVASHELKTPITSIDGNLILLETLFASGDLQSGFSPSSLTEILARSRRQMDYLIRLVEGLLNVRRLSEGFIDLHRTHFDFLAVVRRVAERTSETLSGSISKMSLSLPERVDVKWDELRIEQVVTNLFQNALKFGEGRPIEAVVEERGDQIFFRISDQGIGIDSKDHDIIFEQFGRAVSAKNYSGLGLGLYITRQIVNAHGGSVRVESALSKGSSFLLQIPSGVQKI
jgi:signal transduction histidine kinase